MQLVQPSQHDLLLHIEGPTQRLGGRSQQQRAPSHHLVQQPHSCCWALHSRGFEEERRRGLPSCGQVALTLPSSEVAVAGLHLGECRAGDVQLIQGAGGSDRAVPERRTRPGGDSQSFLRLLSSQHRSLTQGTAASLQDPPLTDADTPPLPR
eukprot:747807-Hanusia_phi.AAC.1